MPQPATGLYDTTPDNYFVNLETGYECYTTCPNYPREEYELVSIEKIWSIIAATDLSCYNTLRVYINHTISDMSQALPIRYSWSGGSRVYTNKYHFCPDEEIYYMDGGHAVLTGSKAGLKRRAEISKMIFNSLIPAKKAFTCTCGKSFQTRQGRYKHQLKCTAWKASL